LFPFLYKERNSRVLEESLRTCFRREFNKQRKGKSGQATNKHRKYVYFDQLLYLLPTMQDKETLSESSPPQEEEENSENEEEFTEEAIN
jgi:hypothetical protein